MLAYRETAFPTSDFQRNGGLKIDVYTKRSVDFTNKDFYTFNSRIVFALRLISLSRYVLARYASSQKHVANGLHNSGSSTSTRYEPFIARSSVDNRSNNFGSLEMSTSTKSRAFFNMEVGRRRDAESKRLAKAAVRMGDLTPPDRAGNARESPRNRRSSIGSTICCEASNEIGIIRL